MANSDINIFVRAFDKTASAFKSVNTKLANLKMSWVDVVAVYKIAETAMRTVVRAINAVTTASSEQEDAVNRLGYALRLQGGNITQIMDDYTKLANTIQMSTRYGDEAILDVMKTLVGLGNVAPENMQRATQAVVDFATITGRDISTASLLIAKASQGSTAELSRYGIVIDDTVPKGKKFEAVLALIEKRFGKSAQNDANTYAGLLAKIGNQYGDILEKIGGLITENVVVLGTLRAIEKVLIGINTVAEKIGKNKALIGSILPFPFNMIGMFSKDKPDEIIPKDEPAKMSAMATYFEQFKKGFGSGIQKMKDEYVDFSTNVQTMTANMAKNIETTLGDVFYDGLTNNLKGAKEIFHEFCNSLLREWINMSVRMSLYGIGGESSGGGWLPSLLKMGAGAIAGAVGRGIGSAFNPATQLAVGGVKDMGSGAYSHGVVFGNGQSYLIPSQQLGTTYVGSNGLYMLHRGEQVVPPSTVRERNQGGGRGGDIINVFNISAMDSQDIMRRRKDIANAVAVEIKNNAGIRGVIKEQK
jgi:hypothetical protein